MTFQPGQSGNPAGRPKGARNRTTLAMEALLDADAESITAKAIELAVSGDSAALRLCLERLMPARKDRPVQFDLPIIERSDDLVKASAAILNAVAKGELTLSEAMELSRIVESHAKTIELVELDARLAVLEATLRRK